MPRRFHIAAMTTSHPLPVTLEELKCLSGLLQVFEAVVAWVKKDAETRGSMMSELMRKVRLPLLTPEYLADHVGQEELVKNSLQCRYKCFWMILVSGIFIFTNVW